MKNKMKNATQEKREIRQYISMYIDLEELLKGTIQEVADKILGLETIIKSEFGLNTEILNLYTRFELEYDHNFDARDELQLYGIRMETDKEFEDRLKLEKKEAARIKRSKQSTQERELKLYAKLKKKYENK